MKGILHTLNNWAAVTNTFRFNYTQKFMQENMLPEKENFCKAQLCNSH